MSKFLDVLKMANASRSRQNHRTPGNTKQGRQVRARGKVVPPPKLDAKHVMDCSPGSTLVSYKDQVIVADPVNGVTRIALDGKPYTITSE